HARDAVSELGRAREGVGAAARLAENGEAVDPQRVGERSDVLRGIEQRPPWLHGRKPEAGPLGREHANPTRACRVIEDAAGEPGAWEPMEVDKRSPFWIPVLGVPEPSAIRDAEQQPG